MTEPITPEELGCSDHGCIFGHPGGQGTNGGCRCLDDARWTEGRGRLRAKIVALRSAYLREREAREEIKVAAREFLDAVRRYVLTEGDTNDFDLAEMKLGSLVHDLAARKEG